MAGALRENGRWFLRSGFWALLVRFWPVRINRVLTTVWVTVMLFHAVCLMRVLIHSAGVFFKCRNADANRLENRCERIFGPVKVPPEYWAALVQKNALEVCSSALVSHLSPRGFVVPFLNWNILVDRQTHCIFQESKGDWDFVDNPLLELLLLIYLLNAGPESLSGEKVGVQDLKDAHFFQGPHEIDVKPLLGKFGKDAGGFRTAADILGGASLKMGDVAYRFLPFPKIPLYYVLWIADGEFDSSLSLMFDRSIERHLQADAILGIVELVSYWLLYGPEGIS